jgi:hypothetical protein
MGWRGRDCQEGKGRGDASLGLSRTHPSPGDCSHCMGMPDQGLCRSSSPWKARPGQLPRRGGRADNSSAMGIEGRSQPLQGKGQTWVVRLRDSALWHQGEADQDTIYRNPAAVRSIFSNPSTYGRLMLILCKEHVVSKVCSAIRVVHGRVPTVFKVCNSAYSTHRVAHIQRPILVRNEPHHT